jgi:tetratricopeptide (TPR) repeat protein
MAALIAWPAAISAQSVEEWFAKGLEALKKGEPQDAMHYFGDSSRWAPDSPEVRFNLAKSLYDFKAYREASLSFEQAEKLSPDPLFRANSRVGQGNAMFRESEHLPPMQAMQRLQQCIAAYHEALQLDPHVFHAEHNLHVAERRLEQVRDQVFGGNQNPGNGGQGRGPRTSPQQVLDQSARPRPRPSTAVKRAVKPVEHDW